MKRLLAAPVWFSLFALLSPASALTDSVPKLDVAKSCHEAQAFADEGTNLAYKGCMQDEQDALKQLQQKWSSFKAEDRRTCIAQGISPMPSYVEILTCIEMYDSASIMYKPQPGPGASTPAPAPASPPASAPGGSGK
jgi:uncharacterized protein YecT (DUF1311 family)